MQRCRIERCFSLLIDEILLRLKVCNQECNYFRRNGRQYNQRHFRDCLARTRDKEDSEREREILTTIQCKKDPSFWQRLNYVIGKPRSGSVKRVLVEDKELGTLTEHLTQELVQEGHLTTPSVF
jgi:hypothetical protein